MTTATTATAEDVTNATTQPADAATPVAAESGAATAGAPAETTQPAPEPTEAVKAAEGFKEAVAGKNETIGGVIETLDSYGVELGNSYVSLWSAAVVMLVIVGVFVGARLLSRLAHSLLGRATALDDTQKLLAEKLLTVAVWSLAVLIGIDLLGIDLTALAVFSGAFGLAIGCSLLSPAIRPEELIPSAESVIEKYAARLANLEATPLAGPTASRAALPPPKLVATFPLSEIRFGQFVTPTRSISRFDLISVGPKGRTQLPCVLILDPEIWTYYHAGMDLMKNPNRQPELGEGDGIADPNFDERPGVPDPAERETQTQQQLKQLQDDRASNLQNLERILPDSDRSLGAKAYQAYYAWASPLGSQFLKQGYRIVFPHPRHMAELRELSVQDWALALRDVSQSKMVAEDSLSVVATREFADIGLQVGLIAEIKAIVVEEPAVPINSSEVADGSLAELPADPWSLLSEESRFQYFTLLKSIRGDILLVRDKSSPFFEFNNRTLIETFLSAQKDFLIALLDETARVSKIQALPLDRMRPELDARELRQFRYDYQPEAMGKWIDRALAFVAERNATQPRPLPDRLWSRGPSGQRGSDTGILAPVEIDTTSSQSQPPPSGGR